MPNLAQGRRFRSESLAVPPGLRLLLAGLAVSLLASASPGRDEALRVMALTVDAPQDLGNGLTLRYAKAEGATWIQAIGSDEPLEAPGDQEFRAMVRDRCEDERLGALIARGATVLEPWSFGPRQVHVFTLTMSPAICDQLGM